QLSEPDQEYLGQSNRLQRELNCDVGTISSDSFRSNRNEQNHDWALISMNRQYWFPNSIPTSPKLPTHSIIGDEQPHRDTSDITLFSAILQAAPQEQSVMVLTCRGPQRGTLASNHSSVMISPGRSFVETFDFFPC